MPRIVTIESLEPHYRCTCSNGAHHWYADEQESSGGGDTAPSPTEILLSAMGSCAINTLRMYAARKEWPLEKVRIRISLETIKSETGTSYRIHEEVELTGPLDQEQKDRLRSLLPKCPVTRVVTGQVELVF